MSATSKEKQAPTDDSSSIMPRQRKSLDFTSQKSQCVHVKDRFSGDYLLKYALMFFSLLLLFVIYTIFLLRVKFVYDISYKNYFVY